MHSDRSPLVSVVLSGASGTGKTAVAAKLGVESGFPLVKRISGENMLNLTELGKAEVITKAFNDAYKSSLSMIILDDLERLLEYVPVGPRFSNTGELSVICSFVCVSFNDPFLSFCCSSPDSSCSYKGSSTARTSSSYCCYYVSGSIS